MHFSGWKQEASAPSTTALLTLMRRKVHGTDEPSIPRDRAGGMLAPTAASPFLPSVGNPWTPIKHPSQNTLAVDAVNEDRRVQTPPSSKDPTGLDIVETERQVVSPLAMPTFDEIYKPPSPTTSRTSGSSYSLTTETVAHASERSVKQLTGTGGRIQSTRATSHFQPQQRLHFPRKVSPPKPHVFESPSPDETSDPEEQKRRKEARAREQQQLILERVQAARNEKTQQTKSKVS